MHDKMNIRIDPEALTLLVDTSNLLQCVQCSGYDLYSRMDDRLCSTCQPARDETQLVTCLSAYLNTHAPFAPINVGHLARHICLRPLLCRAGHVQEGFPCDAVVAAGAVEVDPNTMRPIVDTADLHDPDPHESAGDLTAPEVTE